MSEGGYKEQKYGKKWRPAILIINKILRRSLSQISSKSSGSMVHRSESNGGIVHRSESCRKLTEPATDQRKRTLSSSDLVTIFPEDEERRSFKVKNHGLLFSDFLLIGFFA